MQENVQILWFSIISIILIIVGLIFSVFGLYILPVVNQNVLLQWTSSIYGAGPVGRGISHLFIGRYAIQNKNFDLLRFILYGLFAWLFLEAVFSLYYEVYFNVGVDIVVFLLFVIPLLFHFKKDVNKKV